MIETEILEMICGPAPKRRTSRIRRAWAALFGREAPDVPVEKSLHLIIVGGRGRGSVELEMPRDASTWIVEGCRASNRKPITLSHAPNSSRWLLLDDSGRLLYEGEFRRIIRTVEIPAGAIKAFGL